METEPIKNSDSEFKTALNRKYVIPFKILAFSSFILGLILLSTCFWVLIAFLEDDHEREGENNPTASSFRLLAILVKQPGGRGDVANNKTLRTLFHNTESESDHDFIFNSTTITDPELRALQKKFVTAWNEVSPYFQGATGLALVLGLVQVVACMAILSSSTKGASKPFRALVWKIVHSILVLGFLICILIPVSIDKSLKDGGIRDHLEALAVQLRRNKSVISSHTELDTEDVDNMKLLYVVLLMDAIGVSVLLVGGHFILMHFRNKINMK